MRLATFLMAYISKTGLKRAILTKKGLNWSIFGINSMKYTLGTISNGIDY